MKNTADLTDDDDVDSLTGTCVAVGAAVETDDKSGEVDEGSVEPADE